MDLNQIIIAGEIGWSKLSVPNGMPFGSITVKLNLPKFEFTMKDETYNISNPMIWLNISVSKDKSNQFKKRDQYLIDMITENKAPYLITDGAKISNWTRKGKDGAPDQLEYKVECSAGSVSLSNKMYGELNECIFKGKVTSHEPNGKMTVECSYLNPKNNEWKTREIPVIYTKKDTTNFTGQKILLFGKVCNVSPSGETKLYIVTDKIFPM